MTDMLVAQTVVSTASSLLRDFRFARGARLDTLPAEIDETRELLSRSRRAVWLAAVMGLSLLALGGPP